jgi:eukaryotic-like serine/threonine-protein kinase
VSDEDALGPRATPVADRPAGRIFGPYRTLDTLVPGERDMTFLAERADTGARVALRVLVEEPARETGLHAALRDHVTRLGALTARCPAIAAVYDCGRVDGGGIFLAFEQPPGPTLHEVLRGQAPLHPERAVRLAARIAEALESAHMLGITHGSLTPWNVVVLGEDEAVKLTQFGVDWVCAARDGGRGVGVAMLPASAPYLAPEQSAMGDATPQSDVYAVGAILYGALAGRPPEPQAASRRRVSITPLRKVRPDIARTLEHVVTRALEPDPERRYRDMTDLFNDLWSEISPFSTETTTPEPDAMRRRTGKGRARVIAVGVVLGAVVMIAAVSRLLVSEPPDTPAVTSAPPPAPAARSEFGTPIPGPAIPSTPALPVPSAPTVAEPAPPAAAPAPASEPAPALPPAQPPVVTAAPPAPPRPAAVRPAPAAARPAAPPAKAEIDAAPRPAPEPPRAAARAAPRPAAAPEPGGLPVLRPDTPAPARDGGEDGGAIIDWLLKESSSSRR